MEHHRPPFDRRFVTKNNADCVLDKATQAALTHSRRDLDRMADYLLDYYAQLIAAQRMTDRVQIGELPFRWQTDYHFPWMGGWVRNQDGQGYERNLLVKIPGRDRKRSRHHGGPLRHRLHARLL